MIWVTHGERLKKWRFKSVCAKEGKTESYRKRWWDSVGGIHGYSLRRRMLVRWIKTHSFLPFILILVYF